MKGHVMSQTRWMPPPDKTDVAGHRPFVELYGRLAVMNTYLKITVVLLAVVCVGLVIVDLKTLESFRNFQPLVIRVNDVGRAEAVRYADLTYQPQEPEIKYFLSDFVE